MTTHIVYNQARRTPLRYTRDHYGWSYGDGWRASVASATIIVDAPADAATVAAAIASYERLARLDSCPIDDRELLRIIDIGQAVLHIDGHDILLRIV